MPNPLLQNENQELLYVEVYSQYSAGSGIDITSGVISLDPYISASIDSKLASADFGTYSAGVAQDIAYVSANAGKTYSGIAPIVVNDTTISADNFDLIIGSGLAFENNTLYVSAQQGNPDVESLVQTNSGLWNDVSAYQIASGDYATQQDLSDYTPISAINVKTSGARDYVVEISGNEISAKFANIAETANYAQHATDAVSDLNGNELTAISNSAISVFNNVNSNSSLWNEITGVSSTYQPIGSYATTAQLDTASSYLSGAIDYISGNAGKSYTGIAPIVVNNTTNEISADSQDITFGTGLDFTSGVLSVTAQGGDPEVESVVKANSADWGTITALSSTSAILSGAIDYVSGNAGTTYTGVAPIVVNGNTISADSFDLTIGSGLAFENNTLYISAQGGNPEVESYVQTNSASIDDTLTSYQTYSGTLTGQYIPYTGHGILSTYSTNSGISIDSTYSTAVLKANELFMHDSSMQSVLTPEFLKVSSTVSNTETFFTYNGIWSVNNNTNQSAFATFNEITSWNDATTYIQTNSSTIDNTVTNVSTNSGAWGGQSLPISAGAGIKVNLVDNTLVFSNDYNKVVIDEIITAGYYRDGNSIYPILQKTVNIPFTATTAYSTTNVILIGSTTPWSGAAIKWLDTGNSYMNYSNQALLTTNYQLDVNRIGNVVLLTNGALSYRGKDSGSAPITGTFTIKWVEQ